MGRQRSDKLEPKKRSDGYYCLYFTATLATGESKRIAIVRKDEQDVIDEYKRLKAQEYTGTLLPKSKTTVSQWLLNWVDNYKKLEIETTTYNSYKAHIENNLIPQLGHIELQKLTTNDIQKMIGRLSKKQIKKGKDEEGKDIYERLSPRTIRGIHMILSGALQQAYKEGLINKNPAKDTRLPKVERTNIKQKVLTEDELSKVIAAAYEEHNDSRSNKLFYPALLLMIETGVRRGELFGLKWSNVDFKNSQVLIKDTVYDDNGKIKTKKKPKNQSSVRWLPLSQNMMDTLGSIKRTSEFVFTSKNGSLVNLRNFFRAFVRWCNTAGIGKHSPHDLRHTFITDMVNSGESLPTIQSFSGHANVTTLLNVYAHGVTKEKVEAAQRKQQRMQKIMQHASKVQHETQHENV